MQQGSPAAAERSGWQPHFSQSACRKDCCRFLDRSAMPACLDSRCRLAGAGTGTQYWICRAQQSLHSVHCHPALVPPSCRSHPPVPTGPESTPPPQSYLGRRAAHPGRAESHVPARRDAHAQRPGRGRAGPAPGRGRAGRARRPGRGTGGGAGRGGAGRGVVSTGGRGGGGERERERERVYFTP